MTGGYSNVKRIMLSGQWLLAVRLFILASLACGVLADCGGLLVFQDIHPIDADQICIKRYKSPDCSKFATSYDKNDLPQDYPRYDSGIDKPENLHLTGIKHYVGEKVLPGISIRWKSPHSVFSREHLLGFLIAWHSKFSSLSFCNLLLFNTSNPTTKEELNFEYRLLVQEQSLFTVEVHSMPTNPILVNDGFAVSSIITPSAYTITKNDVYPAKWIPNLSSGIYDNGTFVLKFTLPPLKFKLTRFEVLVFKEDDLNNPIFSVDYHPPPLSATNTHGRQAFQIPEKGCYYFLVRILEEEGNRYVEGRCSCWSMVGESKKCMGSCGSVMSKVCVNVSASTTVAPGIQPPEGGVTTIKPGQTENPKPSEAGNTALSIAIGLVSAIIFLMIIFCIIFCLRHGPLAKKSHRKSSGRTKNVNNNSSVVGSAKLPGCAVVPMTEKIVYIIYAREHQPHLQLVEALIAFLNVHCRCKVISQMQCDCDESEIYQWFLARINMADYIIFLNSTSAESLIVAYLSNKVSRAKPASLEDEFFHLGVQYLMHNECIRENNLILVSFNGQCCQKYLQVSMVYTLPQDLFGLLQKLHNLDENTKAYDNWLPLYVENIPHLPEGARLLSAIKAVEDFEECNSGWFEKSSRLLKSLSEDGGYDTDVTSNTDCVSVHLTSRQCDNPVSDLKEPGFAMSLHADGPQHPIGPQISPHVQNCTDSRSCYQEQELSETNTASVLDKLNTEGNNDSMPWYQLHQSHRGLGHAVSLETKPLDGESYAPPETLSQIMYDTFSTALAQINNNGEVIAQAHTDCVANGSNMEPMLKGREFNQMNELKLNPPETLSNVWEENMSTCFRDINDNTERCLNGI